LPQEALHLDADRSTAIFRIFSGVADQCWRATLTPTRVEALLEVKKRSDYFFQVYRQWQRFFDPAEAKSAQISRSRWNAGARSLAPMEISKLKVRPVPELL